VKANYKPDLEGIKFFAVLSIVLYNLDVKLFDGGFIGVDILFVLAGFFTTTTLIRDYEQGSFNYFRFIENRLRRIFPILIFIVLISTLLVLFYQTDREINFFILEALYAVIFASNFLYNDTHDFFLPLSNYLPLLQTWSLSIIFQIYLIFGFCLAVFYPFKINKKILLCIFILLILTSLSLTQFGANLKRVFPFIETPDRFFLFNQPYWAAFFNTNSRIWEFFLGGIYALIKFNNYKFFNNFKKNRYLYNFGFIIIFISIFYFSEVLPHPSIYILPCLLCISFIIFNENKDSYSYKILSNSKIVFLGSLSLSVYLLHYPLIIFFKYFLYLEYKSLLPIILIIIYFISYLTNKYIEKIFNNTRTINRKNFLFFLISIYIFIFLLLGFVNFKKNTNLDLAKFNVVKKNIPNLNFPPSNVQFILEKRNYLKHLKTSFNEFKNESIEKSKINFSNTGKKKNILIIGNSHSEDVYLMFETNKNLFENFEFKFFRMHLSNHLERNNLEKRKIDLFVNDDLFKDADIILIAASFRKYGRYSADIESIPKINKLIKKNNKKIILSSNAIWFDINNTAINNSLPSTNYPALELMYRYSHHKNKFLNNIDKELFLLLNKKEKNKNIILKKISENLDIPFLNEFNFTCNLEQNECKTFDENNNILYQDAAHITLSGAKYYGRIIYDTNWLNF